MLTEQQIEFFHANGYLVVENAVSVEQLDALRADFGDWVEESRQHQDGWGETVNGKARFDVEKGHNADKPALRRINAPHEVSDAFFDVTIGSDKVGRGGMPLLAGFNCSKGWDPVTGLGTPHYPKLLAAAEAAMAAQVALLQASAPPPNPPPQDNAQLAATLDLFDRKLQSSGAGASAASQAS